VPSTCVLFVNRRYTGPFCKLLHTMNIVDSRICSSNMEQHTLAGATPALTMSSYSSNTSTGISGEAGSSLNGLFRSSSRCFHILQQIQSSAYVLHRGP